MNAQEAQTLQLHEMVVWTPDGMRGEVIVKDGSGVKIRWEDGQFGYYQFTDLLSQIERLPWVKHQEPKPEDVVKQAQEKEPSFLRRTRDAHFYIINGYPFEPTIQNPDPRLSLLDLAGLGKLPDQPDRRVHA
jgi:hypothetical protein